MKKRVISLLLTLLFVASSCDNNEKQSIDGNIDVLLFQKENDYIEGNISSIEIRKRLSSSFMVYFTNPGCSACDEFSPIMDEFIKENDYCVFKFDTNVQRNELREFENRWGDKFFKKEDNTYQIVTPSLCVVNESFDVTRIDNKAYMQYKNVFFNHMSSNYKSSNVFINEKRSKITQKSITNVLLNFNNNELINIYENKIKRFTRTSNKQIVIGNSADSGVLLSCSSKADLIVNQDTPIGSIQEYF